MYEITHVKLLSAVKFGIVAGLAAAVVPFAIYLAISIFSLAFTYNSEIIFSLMMLAGSFVVLIFGLIGGAAAGLIFALVYNLLAPIFGGLKMNLVFHKDEE